MLSERIRAVFKDNAGPWSAGAVAVALPDDLRVSIVSALRRLVRASLLTATREKKARGGYCYLYAATKIFVTDYSKEVMAKRTSDLVLQVFRDSAGVLKVRDVQRLFVFAFDFRIARRAVLLAIQWLLDRGELLRVPGGRVATYELPSRAVPPWRRLERAMRRTGLPG